MKVNVQNIANRIIIVDDDSFSNLLSKKIIKKFLEEAEVMDFIIPELALEYIKTEFEYKQLQEKIILLLDINMPTLTGWEFLDKFGGFAEAIQKHFNIYMFSSSIDPADINRAKQHPLVVDMIEKPLNKGILTKILCDTPFIEITSNIGIERFRCA